MAEHQSDAGCQASDKIFQTHAYPVFTKHPDSGIQHLLEIDADFRREALVLFG